MFCIYSYGNALLKITNCVLINLILVGFTLQKLHPFQFPHSTQKGGNKKQQGQGGYENNATHPLTEKMILTNVFVFSSCWREGLI